MREEIVGPLVEYETSRPVDDFVLCGWNCWPLLRVITSFQVFTGKRTPNLLSRMKTGFKEKLVDTALPSARRAYGRRRVLRAARELRRVLGVDPDHNAGVDEAGTDVVVLTQSEKRVRLGACLFDIYSDPLVLALQNKGHRTLVWERGAPCGPRYSKTAWITKRLAVEASTAEIAIPSAPPVWYREYRRWSMNTFGYDLTWSVFRGIVRRMQAQSIVFERWLSRCQARLLISVCWYDPLVMAATLAARRVGVISVDLQHGIQDEGHFAYCGWRHLPSPEYELVPCYFWLWGDGEAERLLALNPAMKAQSKVVVGGNLWHNAWRDEDAFAAQLAFDNRKAGEAERTILVSLQHGPANFFTLILEAISESPIDWCWWIRLHPATPAIERSAIETTLDNHGCGNVDWKMPSEATLYSLIRACDVHVTGHSTCALEALGFGVPTITVNDNGAAAFREYIEAGVVLTAKTGGDIRRAIDAAVAIPESACRESVDSVFASSTTSNRGLEQLLAVSGVAGR